MFGDRTHRCGLGQDLRPGQLYQMLIASLMMHHTVITLACSLTVESKSFRAQTLRRFYL